MERRLGYLLHTLPFPHIIRSRRSPTLLSANGGVVDDLSRLDWGPLVALDPDAQGEETGQDGQRLETHLLAVIHLGLSSPVQELNNVLGHLGGGGGGAILVLNETVEKDTGHTNT